MDSPKRDLISDLVAAREGSARLSEDEVVASAVLLLNAGHEASVNVFGNGLVAMLQLFERTATEDVTVGDVTVPKGQKIAALLGAANRDPAVFDDADSFVTMRDPNPPLARMELVESLTHLYNELPGLHLVGDPVVRRTFVLRGYTSVRVSA